MGTILFVWLLLMGIYFMPTIIAVLNRKCGNKLGIFFLNLFLGWTFIAWVIALVMACGNSTRETIIINNGHNTTEK